MAVYGWAVLSTSLTDGCGLHTVHRCVVFYQFYIVAGLYWGIVCRVRVGIYYRVVYFERVYSYRLTE